MLVVLASDGYAPNQGSARRYVYQVLQVDDEHLRLCAPELGVTSSGGTAWFWNFKKIENQQ